MVCVDRTLKRVYSVRRVFNAPRDPLISEIAVNIRLLYFST